MPIQKNTWITLLLFALPLICQSQIFPANSKQQIDSTIYNKWPKVDNGAITNDGRYICYTIDSQSLGSSTAIIKSWDNKKITKIFRISSRVLFSPNSAFAYWIENNDTLGILNLDHFTIFHVPNVKSFDVKDNLLIYQLKSPTNNLIIKNIKTNKSHQYASVLTYSISENAESMAILQIKERNRTSQQQELNHVKLNTNKKTKIWEGGMVKNIIIDKTGEQISFIDANESKTSKIWHYIVHRKGPPICILNDSSMQIKEKLKILKIDKFSNDGSMIIMTLTEKLTNQNNQSRGSRSPDIWSYNDHKLQSYQLSDTNSHNYTAVLNITSKQLLQLESEYGQLLQINSNKIWDSLAILKLQENDGRSGETNWNISCKIKWSTLSVVSGHQEYLDFIKGNTIVEMSPSGRYIIYFDKEQRDYFSYNISSRKVSNITKGVNEIWGMSFNEQSYRHRNIAGWEKNDASLFIYGQYDIWQLDPSGQAFPLSVTNSYGRKHRIVFSFALDEYNIRYINKDEILILIAFNKENKENGFYQKKMNNVGDPVMLTMGPYIYDITDNSSIQNTFRFNIIKAQSAKKYIIKRMSSKLAPNYFCTSNFKIFQPVSDLHPEKSFNWYTTELHTWTSCDNDTFQGILYKPENFDSLKEYPVILHYYETKSDALNAYLVPEALSDGSNINIPYYTSNGYLIFCPDIHYIIGDPMNGTYKSVISAAKYLSKLRYINPKKMGLQGGSWGGIQTNYLVSRTNLFAAACSASGIADWISGYGSLAKSGNSLQGMYEIGQFRMGGTIWDKQDLYIKNSPVLQAKNISTPILLMHTKDDSICPFSNAVEFFTALRRLGKRSWMLVYPGDHGIFGKEALDFSTRMKQFFDHYLKDCPAPTWMTKGIPVNSKGIKNGYELDNDIKTPKSTLLSDRL